MDRSMHRRAGLRAWLAPALACATTLAAAQGAASAAPPAAAPPPIEHYTKRPLIGNVVVSPSGERIAFLSYDASGRRGLAVMGLAPRTPPTFIAGFGNGDIHRVWWVNDTRLVFEAAMDGAEIKSGGAGTFAVDHDGSHYRELINWRRANETTGTHIVSRVLTYGWAVEGTVDDGSADILVRRLTHDARGEVNEYRLARLDTLTGELRSLSGDLPHGAYDWLLDTKQQPRVVTTVRDGRRRVHLHAAAGEPWQEIGDFALTGGADDFTPWLLDHDGTLIVRARRGDDMASLHVWDVKARRVDPEPLVAVKGFDVDAQRVVDTRTRRLVGLHFTTDRPASYWFDDKLAALQRSLDQALPGRQNRILCGRCESSRFLVVYSASDRQPGEALLYDRGKATLSLIGAARPWIDEKAQGRRSYHRVTTRDGLSMPVYVTHPAGRAEDEPLPAVVLVHGGPWVRGADLQWDAEAQFLASRGWRVIEPEFRGSTGYGWAHFHAGWKQWGHAMQDDLLDAVQWAAKAKLVDASRVCVMGASYGGYAALMAPIRHPGAWRCAVSFAGVTDIDLMYSIHWSDTSELARRYSMPTMIGDPDTDEALLRAGSPLARVAEIKVPVLLAHGAVDRRVPIAHAHKFARAARSAGVALEEAYYDDEGHGWFMAVHQADYYARVEKFLARALTPR